MSNFPGPNAGGGWMSALSIAIGVAWLAWTIHPVLLWILGAVLVWYIFSGRR